MRRPQNSWRGLFDVRREAVERATILGVKDITISRIGARWDFSTAGVERWRPPNFLHYSGARVKKDPLVPVGHIAVLVEGLAEVE